MKQLIHNCPDCGHEFQTDRCVGLCEKCGSFRLKSKANPDAPAINDTRSGFLVEASDV